MFWVKVKDREAYYIDLQLLRVTKKLQAVLKGDRGDKDKELVQKTEARVEMMEKAHESKVWKHAPDTDAMPIRLHYRIKNKPLAYALEDTSHALGHVKTQQKQWAIVS